MEKSYLKSIILSLLFLLAFTNSHATIIDNGTYTTDSASGLDWLDLTITNNRSFDDISSHFGVGGDFEGWHYATGNEFNQLVSHFTDVVVNSFDHENQETDLIDGLILLLGDTLGANLGIISTRGLLADANSPTSQWSAVLWSDDRTPTSIDYSDAHFLHWGTSQSDDNLGSFLVRAGAPTTVPEPSIIALMGFGLLGFIFIRRKF